MTSKTNETLLRECPFRCLESYRQSHELPKVIKEGNTWHVECGWCGATAGQHYFTEEAATVAWNTRTTQPNDTETALNIAFRFVQMVAVSPQAGNYKYTAQECLKEIEACKGISQPNDTAKGVEWQPIETAPKDGTKIQVAQKTKHFEDSFVCFWQEDDSYEDGGHWHIHDGKFDHALRGDCLTHWRPIIMPEALSSQVQKPSQVLVAEDVEAFGRRKEQARAQFENREFTRYYDENQDCPEHSLITRNACHATWQARAALAAMPSAQLPENMPHEMKSAFVHEFNVAKGEHVEPLPDCPGCHERGLRASYRALLTHLKKEGHNE